MSKVAKLFRLDLVAVDHLDELAKLTGSSQAAIIEQSLAIYRSLLVGGLSGPRRILAGTTPPEVAASGAEVGRPQRPATQRLAEARGAARRVSARELVQPTPEIPGKAPLTAYQLRVRGSVYTFVFPVAEIRVKGSDACPCASG
jgi:hypothetical protein